VQKTRKELKSEFKEAGTPAGIFQVRNLVNGKILIGKAQNIPGILNSQKFQLRMGSHPNRQLQADWNTFGADSFVFETLDVLAPTKDQQLDLNEELTQLLELWLEKLKPYGENGYNKETK
jgi:hypothetical protein